MKISILWSYQEYYVRKNLPFEIKILTTCFSFTLLYVIFSFIIEVGKIEVGINKIIIYLRTFDKHISLREKIENICTVHWPNHIFPLKWVLLSLIFMEWHLPATARSYYHCINSLRYLSFQNPMVKKHWQFQMYSKRDILIFEPYNKPFIQWEHIQGSYHDAQTKKPSP